MSADNALLPAMQSEAMPSVTRTFRGSRDTITAVAFNPNMKQVVSGSRDAAVMLWSMKPQLRAIVWGRALSCYAVALLCLVLTRQSALHYPARDVETTAALQALAATLSLLSTGKIEISQQGYVCGQSSTFL